jgi:hypothetical protein
MGPRGGVVTQRSAKPCTPVQFWSWPPSFQVLSRRPQGHKIHVSVLSEGPRSVGWPAPGWQWPLVRSFRGEGRPTHWRRPVAAMRIRRNSSNRQSARSDTPPVTALRENNGRVMDSFDYRGSSHLAGTVEPHLLPARPTMPSGVTQISRARRENASKQNRINRLLDDATQLHGSPALAAPPVLPRQWGRFWHLP